MNSDATKVKSSTEVQNFASFLEEFQASATIAQAQVQTTTAYGWSRAVTSAEAANILG